MIVRAVFAVLSLALLAGCATSSGNPAPGQGEAALYRDDWGVPHVYAQSEADGFYALGYAVAEDNLEGLLRVYLELSGRAASVFGPGAVEVDAAARLWRIAEDAEAGFARLPARLQANHRGFIAGVRRFMRDHRERMPAWAPELEEWMPLASTHSFNLFLSVYQRGQGFEDCGVRAEVARFRSARLEAARTAASNQWVIAPSRTADQATIVWADSHSSFAFARDEVRLHAGELDVSGVMPLGMALPLIGHNNDVAWSYTVGGPDVSDCYRIETDPDDPGRYVYDGAWRRFIERRVTIKVAGAAPVERTLEYSDHNGRLNPIIARAGGAAFALSSAHAGDAAAGEAQLDAMARARSIDEFAAAHAILGLFPENVMAGDRHGRTYYVSFGRTPVRDRAYAWNAPVSGNTSATQWRGYHDLADLIQERDPQAGWMRNTNNAADLTLSRPPRDFPAYILNDVPGRGNERAARSAALLDADAAITTDEALAIGMDEAWPQTAPFQAALRQALAAAGSHSNAGAGDEVLERLLAFDGRAHPSSREALAFYAWREALRARAEAEGLDAAALQGAIISGETLSDTQAAAMRQAVRDAGEMIETRFGGMEKTYGDVFRIGRSATDLPLGGVRLPALTGSEATLRAFSCAWDEDRRRCRANSGQRHPMLTVFDTRVRSWSGVPYGQSSRADSPHYSDQSLLASEARLKPTYFHWNELNGHIASRTLLDTEAR